MRLADIKIPLIFAAAKLTLHLLTNTRYGFHRDELLYLALGKRPDWGFWSNPPFIGFISFMSQNLLGDSLFVTRLAPALFGAGILFFTCLAARDLGGKNFAQIMAGIAAFTSLAYLRTGHMFMPVVVDIFWWTISIWLVIRFLKTQKTNWLLGLGVAAGLGLLNKYSVIFLIAALAIAFLLTPERRVFQKKQTWLAAGIALLIVLPNLIWQWKFNFPVIYHMTHLAETQLAKVNPFTFLLDQLLLHFWGFLVWIPGLLLLLQHENMRKYRVVGWTYVATLLLFLALSGKNYYTLGAYPTLMAAGGVFWEEKIQTTWKRWSMALCLFVLNLPLLPTGIPILAIPQSVAYFRVMMHRFGIYSANRWEQGNIEPLPQDYADMLGWQEIASFVDEAVSRVDDPKTLFLYCENYGQAGAVERFSKKTNLPPVVSFSDTYRIWAPDTLPPTVHTMIYVNDELGEDVQAIFANIDLVGEVREPLARERGTKVYLCQAPLEDLTAFWKERAAGVKAYFTNNK